MPRSDPFALKNSGLNEFLFAEVGNEVNGSPLTILSVLARLGQDPWAEAARLAKLPKARTIDYLANSISQMPLSPRALIDARATAARVTSLLPSQSKSPSQPISKALVPTWVPLAVLFAAVVFGIVYEATPSATPASLVTPFAVAPVDRPLSGQAGNPNVN
jgi:hypothetical protein